MRRSIGEYFTNSAERQSTKLEVSVKVLFCSDFLPAALEALRFHLPEHEIEACSQEHVLESVGDAEVIISARARIDATVLDQAKNCRLIQQFGAGLDNVDVEAAREQGVYVANVPTQPSGNAASVAELAIFFMIGLARDFCGLQAKMKAGCRDTTPGFSLRGKTVGIVGFGSIGKHVAQLLQPFDSRVLAVKRTVTEGDLRTNELAEWLGDTSEMKYLLSESDFVVLCLPLNDETRGMIGREEMAQSKQGAYFINVSRGPIIDREAFLDALESGHLGGAGLDVLWQEHPDPQDPIFEHKVLATPHVAGFTLQVLEGVAKIIARNVNKVAAKKSPNYRIV